MTDDPNAIANESTLVGGRLRWQPRSDECTHRGINVCAKCAGLTPDEEAALKAYFVLLRSGGAS